MVGSHRLKLVILLIFNKKSAKIALSDPGGGDTLPEDWKSCVKIPIYSTNFWLVDVWDGINTKPNLHIFLYLVYPNECAVLENGSVIVHLLVGRKWVPITPQ